MLLSLLVSRALYCNDTVNLIVAKKNLFPNITTEIILT
jgi:hypothetical protein